MIVIYMPTSPFASCSRGLRKIAQLRLAFKTWHLNLRVQCRRACEDRRSAILDPISKFLALLFWIPAERAPGLATEHSYK